MGKKPASSENPAAQSLFDAFKVKEDQAAPYSPKPTPSSSSSPSAMNEEPRQYHTAFNSEHGYDLPEDA